MVIIVTYSTDSSVELALKRGNFDELKKEVECYSAIDKVWLVTQDTVNYSNHFFDVLHFPCGVRISRPLNWPIYYLRAFLTIRKHARVTSAIRAYGVGCPHAALLSKIYRVPFVVSYEYDWSEQLLVTGRRSISYISRVIESFIFSSADVVVGLSRRLCETAKRRGAKNVSCITNGVDMKSVPVVSIDEREKSRETFGLANRKIVLYVRRLHRIKRIGDLIRAVYMLHKKGLDVSLLIVGEGEERSNLEKLVREMNLENEVFFVGGIPHEQVYRFMQIANVLVLPSVMEGNPRVLIEAMFCKVVIVAANVVGINDLIISGEDGLLVSSFSLGELSLAIELVLSDQVLARRLVNQAYKKASEIFDLEKLLKRNVEVVSSVMRRPV